MSAKNRVLAAICFAAALFVVGCNGTEVRPDEVVEPQSPRENRTQFAFPVGYEQFHEDESVNFLLNRIYSFGYARHEDLEYAAQAIGGIGDVEPVMQELAANAETDGRFVNAAFYYRAAEFYTPWDDSDKSVLFDRFRQSFARAFSGDEFEVSDVTYADGVLSVMRVEHETVESRGTIILHGGYDSYKEELYSAMRYLASYGYDVINFDVPWMSRSGQSSETTFDFRWERIITAILDHYELEEATLFGISYGGWLALRAAAFEPRVTRVVASSVSFDVNQYEGRFAQAIARFARTRMTDFANKQIREQMETDAQSAWFFDHLMHVTGSESPIEAANVLARVNEENLHSELVSQDVLILTGRDDHLVPFKMHGMQVEALENARSVTPLVFTEETQGHNHCQIGNFALALDVVLDWLDELDR